MLSFEHVSHHFGARTLFQDFNQTLPESRIVLTGANGMGKTTLLLIAAGVLVPSAGTVYFNQQPVTATAMRHKIGISANKVSLPGFFTVMEMLSFQARQFNCPANNEWIERLGLSPFLNTKVDDLSLGNNKKLSLILALMHQPELLLLDEPTNGLDEQTRQALDNFLASYPGQIVIASHETGVFADATQVRHLHLDASGVHAR
ncbi:ATP-binding cassette domain-containing protein [Alteromonas lipolytica]|uniref:ABC transporter ATP-binding protein n=1 Tax=Alteromonas lipolytica TaxID=1856405 RepID=A0A1E8FEI3_9ALTE|nr:ABC transporter ATP-binding protein [Alteromonas lipolytica]OFI34357.1 ABC transporter ATP-binding protein [Alteromonas lipolytica]GGF82175.1 hypothetical protein GCM10011338_38060 [Alteromonas lipolytica]